MIDEKVIVDKYLGVPYRHQGRNLEGLDCWGLIVCIYKDFGVELFDIENYPKDWSSKGSNYFLENYYQQWSIVKVPQLWDVVLFNGSKGMPNHAGVVLSGERFIHSRRGGTVIGNLYDWKDKVQQFYRYKGLNGNA